MIKLSGMSEGMVYAHGKGYRVNKKGGLINPSGKVLKGTKDRDGYLRINVTIPNSPRVCYIHRLAAYQKFGDAIFEKGIQVRHLNGNPADNSLDNIAIGTAFQNWMDIPEAKRTAQLIAAREKYRTPDEMLARIGEDRDSGLTGKELSEKYRLTIICIRNILTSYRRKQLEGGF